MGITFFFERFVFNSRPHAAVLLAEDNQHSFNESVGEGSEV